MYQSLDDLGPPPPAQVPYREDANVPDYLMRHYWWAYIHPKAVQIFDRSWLINLILLGNYRRLRRAAQAEFDVAPLGNILQVACVYGDLTPKIAKRAIALDGMLDVVDVLPIQLKNLKWKLPPRMPARLLRMDSSKLDLPDGRYDHVLLFFLLHEQPPEVRAKTLSEAVRVLRPGGKLVILDYGKAHRWNPLRYLMAPLLAVLEPYTRSLIRRPIAELLPPDMRVRCESFFGGFYQKVVATR